MSKYFYLSFFLMMGLFFNGCVKPKIISPVKTLEGHQDIIWSVTFSPTGEFLASGGDNIKLWNIQSGKCLATFGEVPRDTCFSITFSPDGKILASGYFGGEVRLWDVSSRKCVSILSGHEEPVPSVAYSNDGKLLATVSWDGIISLWDTETYKCIKKLKSPEKYIVSVAFVPGTNLLVSVNQETEPPLGVLRIWNTDSEESVAIKDGFSCPKSVAVNPDGELVATGGVEGNVLLWNLQSRKLFAKLRKISPYINAVAFSPDGTLLASSGLDWVPNNPTSNIRLWDVKKMKCIAILKGNNSLEIHSIAFSPDGKYLASGGSDKTINIWEIK